MARPALVIGVGGAGQWVLTHLKKDLLETYNNRVPDEVKLLSFDTLKHPSALAGNDPRKDQNQYGEQRQKKAGAVELKDGIEYIHVGADLNPLIKQIKDGQQPHLSWMITDKVLQTLPQAALQCDDGAGAIRQLGRLCLINDVQSGAASRILNNIRNAITRISNAVHIDSAHRLEIIIVGSLAGGTGAGMLVDMPLLCRRLSSAYAGNVVVRGFIVTPRAFTSAGIADSAGAMLASSFAAWRELDRWMITSDFYGGNRVQYSSIDATLNVESQRRLYDITYMIDPLRTNNPLPSGHPEQGLYPAIANVISAILDDRAGQVYSQDVAININSTLVAHPSKPLHSAVGSFTIKEPVFYEQMSGAFTLSKKVLEIFLAPIMDESGRVKALRDNANGETDQAKIRQVAAADFLAQDQVVYQGMPYSNTFLEKRISEIYQKRKRSDKNYISQISKGPLEEEKKAIKDVGADSNGQTILKEYSVEERYRVWDDVPPSIDRNRDPNAKDEKTRLEQDIQRHRRSHFGQSTAEGDRGGKYGETLDDFKDAHVGIFKKELRAYTEMVLNGIDNNPQIARGGKLGWLLGFHEGLVEVIDYYLGFLQDVIDERNGKDLNKSGNARTAVERAWKTFDTNPKKSCWITVWDQNIHPESHRLQRTYLRAEDRVNQVRKEEIVILKTVQTVLAIKQVVESSLKSLREWELYLAKGKIWSEIDPQDRLQNVEHEIKGLYHAVLEELQNVDNNYSYDQKQKLVSDMLPGNTISTGDDLVNSLLTQLQWTVKQTKTSLEYTLVAQVPTLQEFKNRENEGGDKENLELLTLLAEQPFANLLASNPPQPLAKSVQANHPQGGNGKALAQYLNRRAEPLYTVKAGSVGPLHKRHAFLRVNDASNPTYFQVLISELTALDNTVFFEPLTPSQDNFKLTYIRFDDCIESQDFDIWDVCRESYRRYVNNPMDQRKPRDFHVFPAELHACEYEEKITDKLQKSYYTLHPKMVALLDDAQRIEMFFRALALGYIRKQQEDAQIGSGPHWVYSLKGDEAGKEIWLTLPDEGYGNVDNENEIWFLLMHQFVIKGCDIRSSVNNATDYQINWEKLRIQINQEIVSENSELIHKYECQMKESDGIVKELRSYVTHKRSQFPNQPAVQQRTAVPHEHLADLAETIYKIAISQDIKKR